MFTAKQFLISFKNQSTKQVQLVSNKVHGLCRKKKKTQTNSQQDLLNTQEALMIFQNVKTTVPLFSV